MIRIKIMKKQFFLIAALICFLSGYLNAQIQSQPPYQFNYQGVLRNPDGSVVANKMIRLRLSVLDGSATGTSEYTEERQVTTTPLGLYVVAIGGQGAISTQGSIAAVNWAAGLKFLKVEVDLDGGTSFVTAGTSQLLSVPYSLYSVKAGTAAPVGTASGDLSGSYPNPQVAKIRGIDVSSAAPSDGEFLRYDGNAWTPVKLTLGDLKGKDVTTSNPDIIQFTNATGAVLTDLAINVKPGNAGSVLVTDNDNKVTWQKATDAHLVTGTLSNITLDKLTDNSSDIAANTSALAKITVPGAKPGDPVFITVLEDSGDFSVAASWVSALNEVSIRFANYQPVPVSISGKKYKVLLIQ